MPIDARIPLGFEFGDKTPGITGYKQGLTLRDAARQSQMQEVEYGYQQEQRAKQAETDRITGETVGGMVPPELRELARVNPQSAMKLWEFKKGAAAEQIEAVKQQQGALANAAAGLRNVPYAQRRQALQQMAPQLEAMGVSGDMIGGFDPSDAAIDGIIAQSIGVVKVLEFEDKARDNRRQDAKFAYEVGKDNRDFAYRANKDAADRVVSAGGISKGDRKAEADLRKEFNANPDVKQFREVVGSYRQIKSAIGKPNPSAADDMSAIFSYMKMLDPGSVVREGEFANAQNTTGVPDRVINAYNNALSGNRLNPQQRREFLNTAGGIVVQRGKRYNEIANEFRGYGNDYGISPDRIARPVPDISGQQRPAAGGAASGGNRVIQFDKNGKRVR